jgi:hypothetical protein
MGLRCFQQARLAAEMFPGRAARHFSHGSIANPFCVCDMLLLHPRSGAKVLPTTRNHLVTAHASREDQRSEANTHPLR